MEKKNQSHCASCFTAKQKWLVIGLFLISFLCSIWYLGLTFKDYNRYSLEVFQNMDRAIAYKLDRTTGKVKAVADLLEFPVEPFEEFGPSADWAWPNRSEASSELLH